MFVSPRFRDIFASGAISVRRGDAAAPGRRDRLSDEEFAERTKEAEIQLIWLEIADAHRRAAKSFSAESVLAGASDPD